MNTQEPAPLVRIDMTPDQPPPKQRLPMWMLLIVGSITILATAILVLSIVLGIRAGQRQVELQNQQVIAVHLGKAAEYRVSGNLDAALTEYQAILAIEPQNQIAIAGIELLLKQANETAGQETNPVAVQDTPQPPNQDSTENQPQNTEPPLEENANVLLLATPTSALGSEPEVAIADPGRSSTNNTTQAVPDGQTVENAELNLLWLQVDAAYSTGDWAATIEQARSLMASDDTYRADEVSEILFNAYVNLAGEKDRSGQLEEALRLVDAALDLRPDVKPLEQARIKVAHYLDVLTYYGADWARATELLRKLYLQDPDYRDVEERYHKALMAYGDILLIDDQWCEAADQYITAIEVNVVPGLINKRDEAKALCANPPSEEDVTEDEEDTAASVTVASAASVAQGANTVQNTSAAAAPAAAPAPTATFTPIPTATPVPAPVATLPPPTPVPTPVPVVSNPTIGRIFYSSNSPSDGRSHVYFHDVASGQTNPPLIADAAQPAIRGDGQRIAYRNTRSDMMGITSFDPGSGLQLRFTEFGEDSMPSWSPEGNRVVIASNREGDRRWRIYTVWAEEKGGVTNLNFGEQPSWHPAADLIAYRGCDERGNGCGIWLMNGNGGGRSGVTSNPSDGNPAWSGDGQTIVFDSNQRDGNHEIYKVEVATGAVERLTNNPTTDVMPTISPDGNWVAFLTDRGGLWQIWAVPLSGGGEVEVASINGIIGNWAEQRLQWVP